MAKKQKYVVDFRLCGRVEVMASSRERAEDEATAKVEECIVGDWAIEVDHVEIENVLKDEEGL